MLKSSAPSPTLVIDSSLAVWTVMPVVSGTSINLAERFSEWQSAQYRLVAPTLWLAECTSAVRAAVYARAVSIEKARVAIEDLFTLGVEIVPMDASLCQAAFEWAGRLGQVRAYDGFYLTLAEQLNAQFWTADRRLTNSARQAGAGWVHWIGES